MCWIDFRPKTPLRHHASLCAASQRLLPIISVYFEGPQARPGLVCEQNASLIYDGPRDPNALWADESFRFEKMVSVSRAKFMRTRPIFRTWGLTLCS